MLTATELPKTNIIFLVLGILQMPLVIIQPTLTESILTFYSILLVPFYLKDLKLNTNFHEGPVVTTHLKQISVMVSHGPYSFPRYRTFKLHDCLLNVDLSH